MNAGEAGLRLTDPGPKSSCSLLSSRLHPGRFLNKNLRAMLGEYLARPPRGSGSNALYQATYDLRRLSEYGLIERIPRTHRYQVNPVGCARQTAPTRRDHRTRQP